MASEETVYGHGMTSSTASLTLSTGGMITGSSTGDGSSNASDPNAVMNDKVQALAGSIYEEFEAMMGKYDADVLKNLMPLIVNVLESLDLAYTENQEMEVEVELLKEDNEQLVTQYEREKQLRKASENRLIELEDSFEQERKESGVKVDSLTSIVKMFELKAKNSQDQISRLDEKESDMKKEYSKLHERYTDLFKTHIDYMERTKSMLGAERLEQLSSNAGGGQRHKIPATLAVNQINSRSTGPVSFGFSELENNNASMLVTSPGEGDYSSSTSNRPLGASTSLRNELQSPSTNQQKRTGEKGKGGGWVEGLTPELEHPGDLALASPATDVSGDPGIGPATPSTPGGTGPGTSHTKSETRTGNTLYQELSFQDSEAIGEVDEGADITDNESESGDPKDLGFDNGMGKEVENLITENNELLATKNALNIVKDDLIAKVDELTGEHEILREEIRSLQTIRTKLETKVQDLEDEAKKAKEDAEKAAKANKTEEEEDVPLAQRKRFTRVEMARVLMERNQYKERFMELQEAVRWTEMIRASKEPSTGNSPEKRSQKGIWKFFGNLFSSENATTPTREGAMVPYMKYERDGGGSSNEEVAGPALGAMRAKSQADRKNARQDVFDGETMTWNLNHPLLCAPPLTNTDLRHVLNRSSRTSCYSSSISRQTSAETSLSDCYEVTEGHPMVTSMTDFGRFGHLPERTDPDGGERVQSAEIRPQSAENEEISAENGDLSAENGAQCSENQGLTVANQRGEDEDEIVPAITRENEETTNPKSSCSSTEYFEDF